MTFLLVLDHYLLIPPSVIGVSHWSLIEDQGSLGSSRGITTIPVSVTK